MELIRRLSCRNTLGEGIVYDDHCNELLWTDIQRSLFYRYDLSTDSIYQYKLPCRLGSFGLTQEAHCYVMAFEKGIALYCLESGIKQWLSDVEADINYTRSNDCRVDREGAFWIGTMIEDHKLPNNMPAGYTKGSLYRLNSDHSLMKTLTDISISNSLCWSPDGSILYHADTPSRSIYAYAMSGLADLRSAQSLFVKTEQGCYPDGSCIDADGYLWNAQWGASQVVRYSPLGEVDTILHLPISQPSCVCFGGEQLDTLVITSAREGLTDMQLAAEPHAGDVLMYKTPYKGLLESRASLS